MRAYVNIFGLYMSGKTALHDALCTHKDFFSISPHFDLDLIRLPGGVNDLLISFKAFSEHHQAIAIERFLNLLDACDNYGGVFDKYTQQRLRYGDLFSGFMKFKDMACQYLLSDGHYCNHPHSYVYESRFENFSRRVKKKLINVTGDNCFISHRSYEDVQVFFQQAMDELLQTANTYSGQTNYILNNLNFVESVGLSKLVFPHVRQIAVIRNPLDVLTDLHTKNIVHNADPDVSIRINNANNPHEFLIGYDKKLMALKRYSEQSQDLFVLRFEDLVLKYLESLDQVAVHLGIDYLDNHSVSPLEKSKQNVGIWKFNPQAENLYREMKCELLEGISFYYPKLCRQ